MKKLQIIFMLLVIFTLTIMLVGCSRNDDSSQSATDNINSSNITKPDVSSFTQIEIPKEELLNQANVLSEHLIMYSISSYLYIDSGGNNKSTLKSDLTITEISDVDIFRFISSTFIYADNIDHPYTYITETRNINPNDYVLYALENVQTVVSQLFNKNDWFFEENFDDNEGAYAIPTGVGFGNNVTITNVNSLYLEKNLIQTNIAVSTGGIGEDIDRELGNLLITFDVIKENNKMFLRLLKIETI